METVIKFKLLEMDPDASNDPDGTFFKEHLYHPPSLGMGCVSSEIGESQCPSLQIFSLAARFSSCIPKSAFPIDSNGEFMARRRLLPPCIMVLQRKRSSKPYIHIERFISRNWLMQLWGLKPVGQASRLENLRQGLRL